MLTLKENDLIGLGGVRSCYKHPDNPRRCIKIFHNYSSYSNKLHKMEVNELNRLSKKSFKLVVPKYYGSIMTNFGEGHIFDLIQTSKGKICLNLKDYLTRHPQEVERSITQIYRLLMESSGIFVDLRMENILVIEGEESVRYAIIDGFGEGTFVKKCSLIPFLGRRKTTRKWKKVLPSIRALQNKRK